MCVCLAQVVSRRLGLRPHKADLSRLSRRCSLAIRAIIVIIPLPLHTDYFPHGTSARALSGTAAQQA